MSGGQSEVSDEQPSQTSGTDSGRVRNVTEFFFLDRGSQKNENPKISDFSQLHVCCRLTGIQNLLFWFKVNLQDFLDFLLVECQLKIKVSPVEQYFKMYVKRL